MKEGLLCRLKLRDGTTGRRIFFCPIAPSLGHSNRKRRSLESATLVVTVTYNQAATGPPSHTSLFQCRHSISFLCLHLLTVVHQLVVVFHRCVAALWLMTRSQTLGQRQSVKLCRFSPFPPFLHTGMMVVVLTLPARERKLCKQRGRVRAHDQSR